MKIVGSGEDKLPSLVICGRAFGVGRFIIGYIIKDHKREEELVRNSLFYSSKLKICYLLITVFKRKRIIFLKVNKNYRAQRKVSA